MPAAAAQTENVAKIHVNIGAPAAFDLCSLQFGYLAFIQFIRQRLEIRFAYMPFSILFKATENLIIKCLFKLIFLHIR